MGVLLAIAAAGCGDAALPAPDDPPVATSTPAGPVEPVNTESSGDGIWVLDLVDGRPVIEERVVTMRITGNRLDGFDGCNRYGGPIYVGPIEDGTPVVGTPVAGPDGVFSLPSFLRTEKACLFLDHENPNDVMDQGDAYISALQRTSGERYRVVDDRLEILDGEGATRLVFHREAPLPGQPVDLRGTSWRLITEDGVDNDEHATTMIFNGRQVTGSTACRDYLASYEMSEGSVRFPSKSALGSVESCSESDRRRSGEFTSFLNRGRGNTRWRFMRSKGSQRNGSESGGYSRGKTLTFEPLP